MVVVSHLFLFLGENFRGRCDSYESHRPPLFWTIYFPTAPSIKDDTFRDCTSLNSVILPKTLTTIGHEAFYNCTNLNNIIIPDNVNNIGSSAFENCTSLNSIIVPIGVTVINERAFSYCTNLSKITISDSVTTINESAFLECTGLKSIIIPANVTTIGRCAFEGCYNIKEIYFLGNAPSCQEAFCGSISDATVYYPFDNSTWTSEIMKSFDFYNHTATWIPYDYSTDSPLSSKIERNIQQDKEINDNESVKEYNVDETVSNTPVEYYTEAKPYNLKIDIYSVNTNGNYTALARKLTPKSEYLLAVVRDENAENLFASGNLLYIGQGTSDENGAISITYIPKDNTSGTECFFGAGSTQDMRELIAKIKAAEAADTIQAELTSSTNLSGAVLDAARQKQVHLDISVGNGVYWEIDGLMVPAGAMDTELGVVRADKKNGTIPEETISKIAGKYNCEQLNLSEGLLILPSGTDLRIETDSAVNGWKCVTIQQDNDESKLAGNHLIKDGKAYINSVQGRNYLLIYGKNGDVTCDEKVTMPDLMNVLHHVSGRNRLDTLGQGLADINFDNNVNMPDLMAILHYVSGRNTEL